MFMIHVQYLYTCMRFLMCWCGLLNQEEWQGVSCLLGDVLFDGCDRCFFFISSWMFYLNVFSLETDSACTLLYIFCLLMMICHLLGWVGWQEILFCWWNSVFCVGRVKRLVISGLVASRISTNGVEVGSGRNVAVSRLCYRFLIKGIMSGLSFFLFCCWDIKLHCIISRLNEFDLVVPCAK